MRQLSQQGRDVCWLHHLQELVGGIVLQTTDGRGGIEEGKTFLLTEGHNLVYLEALGFKIHKMVLVAKKNLSLQSPVVIDKIRVEKIYTPPLALWWKATEKQHLRIFRKERTQGLVFYPILAAGDMLSVR